MGTQMTIWERVRNWGAIRGIDTVEPDTQYQRCLQEVVEIHDAMIKHDDVEFRDAIGDTIVTLINLAKTKGYEAEECLAGAFNIIELRKGLTTDKGDFVRYGKLSEPDRMICDMNQGNPGSHYFNSDQELEKIDFKRD